MPLGMRHGENAGIGRKTKGNKAALALGMIWIATGQRQIVYENRRGFLQRNAVLARILKLPWLHPIRNSIAFLL